MERRHGSPFRRFPSLKHLRFRMIRLVFATLVLAVAFGSMVGCEKKLVMPTASPKETAETQTMRMSVVIPTNPNKPN